MSIVEMRVDIDCIGCQNKIKKALSKLDGVDDVDVDMDLQKVTVTGRVDQMKILKTVRKIGKSVELWPFPYNPDYNNFTQYYGQYYTTPASNYSDQTQMYNSPCADRKPSTYNYHKHGYNGHENGYYQQPLSADIFDEKTNDMFNDDNATGCTIM